MLLDELGLDGAIKLMPGLIRAYNESTGVANTDSEGYHHSITVFYLAVIADFCREQRELAPHERVTALLASPLADKNYPLTFYSRELLFSAAARRDWVAPDLKPLPAPISL